MIDLLPCWRCGSNPVRHDYLKGEPRKYDRTSVHCLKCGISISGVLRWNRYARKLRKRGDAYDLLKKHE